MARRGPSENDVVVWNYNRPWDELRELLWRADDLSLPRETIDLSSPNAVIYFGRALTGRKNKEGQGTFECFAWRSGDRGHDVGAGADARESTERDELRPH